MDLQSSGSISKQDHRNKIEPEKLLEENWFFGNLLNGKSSRMLNLLPEKSMEETYSSIKKIPQGKIKRSNDPTRISSSMNQQKAQFGHLLRAPSLPNFVENNEEFQDEESDFSMGKLIRQASLNHAKVQPPLPTVKGLTRSCSISTTPKRIQKENIIGCDCEEIKQRKATNQALTRNNNNDFRIEELQRLNNKNISLKLQEKNTSDNDENVIIRRPNSSEAWLVKKSGQDMKQQIMFWARAVASNVRQEC